ncbi:hypothetical protein QT342_09575 [Escherichia coli]|nr:hypothetical protein [Escherichia coli]
MQKAHRKPGIVVTPDSQTIKKEALVEVLQCQNNQKKRQVKRENQEETKRELFRLLDDHNPKRFIARDYKEVGKTLKARSAL